MSLVNHRHSTYTSSLKNRVKVLDFIKPGGPILTVDRTIFEMWLILAASPNPVIARS